MRRMINEQGTKVDVVEHIMLSNLWEYYILEAADDNGIAFALVVRDYTEMGSVSMDEIVPHIVSRTTYLGDIMPAPMWTWYTDKHDFDQGYGDNHTYSDIARDGRWH